MRAYNLTNTTLDLGAAARRVPFLANHTLVALNPTTGSLTVQQSANGSDWTTLATLGAGTCAEITPTLQYLRVSTSATVVLLGN
jgi:hypothetical protein